MLGMTDEELIRAGFFQLEIHKRNLAFPQDLNLPNTPQINIHIYRLLTEKQFCAFCAVNTNTVFKVSSLYRKTLEGFFLPMLCLEMSLQFVNL